MVISIFGLGYVGCVSMGCLAKDGNKVIGVDIDKRKVDLINSGKPTIVEKEIDHIIEQQHRKGRLTATQDHAEAIMESDISMICVGTPPTQQGHLNLTNVFKVAANIGEALQGKEAFHTVVIRSTVMPGTHNRIVTIIEQTSGKKNNRHFAVVTNPEFMREGNAVHDYFHPAMIVLASDSDTALNIVKRLYRNIDAPVEVTDISTAEIIKHVNNSFHALKITFANEVGNICKALGIDSHRVMKVFCLDTMLNISDAYLKPGFAYGGSCLPKDLKALSTIAHDKYLGSPLINSIEKSNNSQIDIAYKMVASKGKKKVAVIGLSFKPGTDDLRHSPAVELVERLIGKGFRVRIYDKNVVYSRLTGTNKAFITERIPHMADLIIDDLERVMKESDMILVFHPYDGLTELLEKYSDRIIIDFSRISNKPIGDNYEGICW